MKKPIHSPGCLPRHQVVVFPPAYPNAASEVIRLLKSALDATERPPGQKLDQKEFAELIGAPKSTVHDWYYGELPKAIKYFLCAMERLSESQKLIVLRRLCREHITLDHPRLAHDRAGASMLRNLISQSSGLTVITGMKDARDFVFTAIGNSASRILHLRLVSGFDFHLPKEFVPVPRVRYCATPYSGEGAAVLESEWISVASSPAKLLLFNGAWTFMPTWRERIIGLCSSRHVIIADESEHAARTLLKAATSVITATRGHRGLIQIHLTGYTASNR